MQMNICTLFRHCANSILLFGRKSVNAYKCLPGFPRSIQSVPPDEDLHLIQKTAFPNQMYQLLPFAQCVRQYCQKVTCNLEVYS